MISEARPENLNRIAALHHTVLQDTFTSQAGKSFISELYKFLLDNKPLAGVFIAEESGEIEGFISVTLDRLEINNKINRYLNVADKIGLALFTLSHPAAVIGLYRKTRLDNYIKKRYGDSFPSILTLGVSPKFQGRGVGRALVLRAEDYFRQQQLPEYFVDTESENKGAIRFYRKLGFKSVTTVSGNIILRKNISRRMAK